MSTQVLNAPISATNAGPTTVLAAPGTGLRYRIFSYMLVTDQPVSLTWRSDSTDLSGTMPVTGNGIGASYNVAGHLVGLENQSLILSLGGDANVGGHLSYWIEKA